jgi:hypothetical protein
MRDGVQENQSNQRTRESERVLVCRCDRTCSKEEQTGNESRRAAGHNNQLHLRVPERISSFVIVISMDVEQLAECPHKVTCGLKD